MPSRRRAAADMGAEDRLDGAVPSSRLPPLRHRTWKRAASDPKRPRLSQYRRHLRQAINAQHRRPPFLRRTLRYIVLEAKKQREQLQRGIILRHPPWSFHLLRKEQMNEMGVLQSKVTSREMGGSTLCPICHQFEGICLEGLWIHCWTTHSEEFKLQPVCTIGGQFHFLARQVQDPGNSEDDENDDDDEESVSSNASHSLVGHQTNAVSYSKVSGELIYWHHRPPTIEVSSERVPSLHMATRGHRKTPEPQRTYHHTTSFRKFSTGEWLFDIDSDDEIDESWKSRVADALLDEFDDVSDKEKQFFKLWNAYMRKNPAYSVSCLPDHSKKFVKKHANIIASKQLDEQLIWHLTNLWDERHIPRSHILECMGLYHQIVDEPHGDKATIP